ncbi:hypothetical protein [Streptomyces sp. NPDC051211]|uniref:hypothetical protein n=1 Tax=Streptomyces sp. NPDC051211 TaxID=3154643 RepID=UPI0034503183
MSQTTTTTTSAITTATTMAMTTTSAITTTLPAVAVPTVLRGRIGAGFSPAPRRYRLYLSADCPASRTVLDLHTRLGLGEAVPVTVLGPAEASPAGHAELRRAYEATGHHYTGMLTVPALCDTWSGRIVSNHTPDILRDLAGALAGDSRAARTALTVRTGPAGRAGRGCHSQGICSAE